MPKRWLLRLLIAALLSILWWTDPLSILMNMIETLGDPLMIPMF